VNGTIKNVGVGTIAGAVSAVAVFVTLNLTLVDRFRGQGAQGASLEGRVVATEHWISDYEKNVRPLRDQFVAFTGELPGIRREMTELRQQIERLNTRLDELQKRQPAALQSSR
jgi:chromosome segregation ATPase